MHPRKNMLIMRGEQSTVLQAQTAVMTDSKNTRFVNLFFTDYPICNPLHVLNIKLTENSCEKNMNSFCFFVSYSFRQMLVVLSRLLLLFYYLLVISFKYK